MDVAIELGKVVGHRNVVTSATAVLPFVVDKSYLPGDNPLAVIWPSRTAQISKIMEFCNKNRINVVVRGGGSSLTGASIPSKRSIVIDMADFSKVLQINVIDQYVEVQPGITIDYLNGRLSKFGYFYPPEPASSAFATVGGTISTNAGGLRALMYGSTKEWVLGLEVVLPTGEVIQTGGKTLKRSVGYDLTSLIVGSEGTLGVVTKAFLKIIPKPEAVGRIVAHYRKVDDAVGAVSQLKTAGIQLIGAELLDKSSLDLIRKYNNMRIPKSSNCLLILDVPSTKESLDRFLRTSEAILKRCGAIEIDKAKTEEAKEKLYLARKKLFETAFELGQKTGRIVLISDVIVPPSQLADAIPKINKLVSRSGFEAQLFSHIGDGNIHVNILAKKTELKMVERLLDGLANVALERGGSVSGEHGIGLEKKDLLVKELKKRNSLIELQKMRMIKKVFDPNGILNSGKIFD